jgi:hypothetical protein
MARYPELTSWLGGICLDHLAALRISCWQDGHNLCFSHQGVDAVLLFAAAPNPFRPEEGPPVCCLGIPARLLTLYRSEITDSAEFIGGLIDELLDELHEWN